MNVYGNKSRGRSKNRWTDCVKDEARKELTSKMLANRDVWKKQTCCADTKSIGMRALTYIVRTGWTARFLTLQISP